MTVFTQTATSSAKKLVAKEQVHAGQKLVIRNEGTVKSYFGPNSGVTTANGFPLAGSAQIEINAEGDVWVISSGADSACVAVAS